MSSSVVAAFYTDHLACDRDEVGACVRVATHFRDGEGGALVRHHRSGPTAGVVFMPAPRGEPYDIGVANRVLHDAPSLTESDDQLSKLPVLSSRWTRRRPATRPRSPMA